MRNLFRNLQSQLCQVVEVSLLTLDLLDSSREFGMVVLHAGVSDEVVQLLLSVILRGGDDIKDGDLLGLLITEDRVLLLQLKVVL